MVHHQHGPDKSHEERANHHMQLVYTRQTRERQIFMDDLKLLRKRKLKHLLKANKDSIGPRWYQVLSVPQRESLDTLEFSIYQDILEDRPVRTAKIMKRLGIYPPPNHVVLMNCVEAGHADCKAMLTQLFLLKYGHPFELKRTSYDLNARLLLSAMLYLGIGDLIERLRKRFEPYPQAKVVTVKPKPKLEPPLASPYLQKFVAAFYEPSRPKRKSPAPLPNLDDLNEPYEEEPPAPKPPPPPPPPLPPKNRLPWSYCDKIAGIQRLEPHTSIVNTAVKALTRTSQRKRRTAAVEAKKTYGLGLGFRKKGPRRRKPVAPSTGIWNAQYNINGVFIVNGKSVFVLGNVSILPAEGELIHGGYKYEKGEFINIHCGFRGKAPPPVPDPCDCVKRWQDCVLDYLKTTKCMCGHHYDFGNEGTFGPEELPYFERATRKGPYQFNYSTIYDIDEKSLFVGKEFKRIWDTDSVLRVADGSLKKDKRKKKKKSSKTCLGDSPTPTDYLKCALVHMRHVNLAARLPDIHLVPELEEWMRKRIYGPFSANKKAEMLRRSNTYWQIFNTLAAKGFGHIYPPKNPLFSGHTTWIHKLDLNKKFREFTQQYKVKLFRTQAKVNNMYWPSMCQAQFPDKKFREIYFCYLYGNLEDLLLMHPYSSRECIERKAIISKKRYICIPAGIEPEY